MQCGCNAGHPQSPCVNHYIYQCRDIRDQNDIFFPTMSSLLIYLHLLISISVTILSALNPGLFLDESTINTFGDPELDQVLGASYDPLLATSPPSQLPTDDNWTNFPSAEPIHPQEIALPQERLITFDVPLQQAAGPNRGDDGIWHYNRPPLPQDSSNTCTTSFQPLGKRQGCGTAQVHKSGQPILNPYNPDMNFLLESPMNPPDEHREPCGLFLGAPRWAICDSADPKDQYPAGITITKATLCMPLASPPPPKKW